MVATEAGPDKAQAPRSPLHVNALILAGGAVFVILVPTAIEWRIGPEKGLPTVAWSSATTLSGILITLATNCLRAKFPGLGKGKPKGND